MFPRPAFHHHHRPSAPFSPAGFRIADYINPKRCFNLFQGPNFTNTSPAPCAPISPFWGPRHPRHHPAPATRLADSLAANAHGTPQRPSPPVPNHRPPRAKTNAKKTNAHANEPLLVPPRRKYKPKRLSLTRLAPTRRMKVLEEKHATARSRFLDHYQRRAAQAREVVDSLCAEAEALMTPEHMNTEDVIFLKQLQALQLDQELKHSLEECRQQVSHAADESAKRSREHKERDDAAAKMWGEKQDKKARKEQKRKVDAFVRSKQEKKEEMEAQFRQMEAEAILADDERRRAHDAQERKIREEQERVYLAELARQAKEEERRRREEQERRRREERERQLREEERRIAEVTERMLRREAERLRREAHEQSLREQRERRAREEREREARLLAEQTARRAAEEEQVRQYFVVYEGKWNELRTNDTLPPIDVEQMPWPVFGVVSSANQITYQSVRTFLFHPQRPNAEGKNNRDMVKAEVLRFHPDKFNTRIVPKIQASQQAAAQEMAGVVARILTRVMAEEVEKQT